ncbi:TIGR02269 family lipoprotein [Hyalangium rubrum]|uniref:TIGR02269 family lipoprotein n=1 Tax=Hyalangium rubrum TaxID=3103134 RepID=A0ABU5H245_9BACT|nr:TIGR02269 family lipoprotein [Hyalangium sp. s54d21]MDY7226858.1 TIGR02269 family lipoprotein [Hyalangium sp. s54d21]
MSSRLRTLGLSVFLAACASTNASLPETREPELVSWEEGCQDTSTLELLCAEDTCAFFRCRDLVFEEEAVSARVEPARWNRAFTPGARRARSGRYPRQDAEPVFLIRWHNHPAPTLPRQHQPPPPELLVKHHIFPQAPDLAAWFRLQGINIHQYTLLIPRNVHIRIHSGGPRGGRWNEAWRHFTEGRESAAPEEIWGHAIHLIVKFDLAGAQMLPYR